MSELPAERVPRTRRRRKWIITAGVLSAIAIAALVYVAAVWEAEPPSMAVGGMSTVSHLASPAPPVPVTFANSSSSGAEVELAAVWSIVYPGTALGTDIDFGLSAFLVIVTAHAGGYFSPRYAITDPHLDSSCLANSSTDCWISLYWPGSELIDNGSVLALSWDWILDGWDFTAPNQYCTLTVWDNLTVTPVVLSGPTTTSLPSLTFSAEASYIGLT